MLHVVRNNLLSLLALFGYDLLKLCTLSATPNVIEETTIIINEQLSDVAGTGGSSAPTTTGIEGTIQRREQSF